MHPPGMNNHLKTLKNCLSIPLTTLLVILGLFLKNAGAQTWLGDDFHTNFRFGRYLLKNEQYNDLLFLTSAMRNATISYKQEAKLSFLAGKAHFELQNFNESGHYFYQSTDLTDTGLSQRVFLGTYALAKSGELAKAESLLSAYHPAKKFRKQYRLYNHLNITLLDRDFQLFDSLKPQYQQGLNTSLDQFYQDLGGYKSALLDIQKKKPWKGAALSALVPGLGKVYAGRPKSGLSNFIQLSILGVQTYEGYRKKGFGDPHFYIFGALFTVFYAGNIWGSAESVKKANHEQYQKIDQQLLKDMRYLNDRFVE